MSFDKNGVYVGHTHEDDEYKHTLRVGAWVEHYSHHYLGKGEVQESYELCNGANTWRVRWDDPGLDDEFYYAHELRVVG